MSIHEVFSCCVKLRYKTTVCSSASVFVVITSVLTILAPCFIICRSNGFWLRAVTYREQPEVHFKEKYILVAETRPYTFPIICSTFPQLNDLPSSGQCLLVKSRQTDNNDDGKFDELSIEFSIKVDGDASIHSIKLILIFDYKLHTVSSLEMESLGFLHYSSGLPGVRYDVVADLHLIQRQLLNTYGKDVRYNFSIIRDEDLAYKTFDLHSTIKEYSKRNVSTKLENIFSLWTTGISTESPFVLSTVVHYSEENVTYRPRFWQIAKWAWIQYLSVLIIFIYIFKSIKTYVFCNYLVPSIKFTPWHKSF